MKTIKKEIAGRMKWYSVQALMLLAVIVCTACDDVIYDDEGDCDPHYYVNFVYDMNMLYSDAFAKQVNSVDLYVFDAQTGKYITHFEDEGDALGSGDYKMSLDNLAPGKYQFVAWCGLANNNHDFVVPANIAQLEDLTCTMARAYDAQVAYSNRNLHALFHGSLVVDLPNKEGDHLYTVKLTKNTNNVNLSLNHMAEELDPERFDIKLTDANGLLAYDNSLLADQSIEYRPWSLRSGSVDVDESGTQASFLQMEFSTSRLMANHDLRISIIDKQENKTIFSIPLVKWALQLRSANYANMDDQEYLDREDEYNLMVFLANNNDDNGQEESENWMAMRIVINGWHVIDNGDVQF